MVLVGSGSISFDTNPDSGSREMIWIPRIRIRHTACGIVGAVLQQKEGLRTDWWPLSFFLAKLETAQMSYSAFDLELYGIFVGICYFRYHLEGRNFTEWTILCGAPLHSTTPRSPFQGNCWGTAEPPAAIFLENLHQPPVAGFPSRKLTQPPSPSRPLQHLMTANFVFVRRGAPWPPLSHCMTAHTEWQSIHVEGQPGAQKCLNWN